jgi:uroporphyrinogen decarboxylase
MTKREVVRLAVTGRPPPYVPWSCGFTHEARATLRQHVGTDNRLEDYLESHLLWLGDGSGSGFVDIGNDRVRDYFGVVWDRSVDKDIGAVEGDVPLANMLAFIDTAKAQARG